MAKKYGFREPPGVTYFRKGKYVNYDGDIDDEEELLDWLTNPENMELTDHIERINRKMFEKIRVNSDYLAVFLCKYSLFFEISCFLKTSLLLVLDSDDCKQCPKVLTEIENIDDDADKAGIKFVKLDDKTIAKEYGVFALPAILFFRLGSKDPVIFAGNVI